MSLSTRVPRNGTMGEACATARHWEIEEELSFKVFRMACRLPFDISIISGYRTRDEQEKLIQNPDTTAAPVYLSNHTIHPARAVDLRPSVAITDAVKIELGRAAVEVGLRWGGGAPVNELGIPMGNEWRHVDLGPRPR